MSYRIAALLLTCLASALCAEASSWAEATRHLAAAESARSQQAEETARWQIEEQRLAVLIAGLEAEAAALAETAGQREQLLATDGKRLETLRETADERRRRLQALTAWAAQVGGQDTVAGAPAFPDDADPAAIFAHLAEVEAVSRSMTLHLVAVQDAGGRERAVQILQAGLVAAWWLALDGSEAGIARSTAAGWMISEPLPAFLAAIRQAVAVVEGRRTPEPIVLPWNPEP